MISRLAALAQQQWPGFLVLAVACTGLLVVSLWLSVIDLRSRLLPNRIVYPSVLIAVVLLELVALISGDGEAVLRVPLAAMVLSAAYLLLRLLSPQGMGWGDVKLALLLGSYLGLLGWLELLYSVLATFLLGGSYALYLVLSHRGNRKSGIAFGPFMFAGTFAALMLPV
ncbi:leader peptidase (prepilin peptidase)/N-methyltransferase [Psychromicrobium silvestre]|uniref:Leader peptidase (Prepilin peptidase)/N-methyltransferase n=1 Tax=Psychromicrobium silvestre TaxID=1645614 RepID=A0A7Y9S909_9MICC|nr:prepilin peptidase [Psychromicrobium silvestre]NYE96531.1 leader peptidase (prepilin peptidase)/N-methyltransferase [Psychromicrobium silvestre]